MLVINLVLNNLIGQFEPVIRSSVLCAVYLDDICSLTKVTLASYPQAAIVKVSDILTQPLTTTTQPDYIVPICENFTSQIVIPAFSVDWSAGQLVILCDLCYTSCYFNVGILG